MEKGDEYLIMQRKDGSTKCFSPLPGMDGSEQPTIQVRPCCRGARHSAASHIRLQDWIDAIAEVKASLGPVAAADQPDGTPVVQKT
mmetsp:Transcript_4631/g.18471  ORF Transcript_4631/g.18471 Transcript_4631/m.18471 type:complete len:86 (+) Transcript_4631:2507-2764(+)|eukprot:scaffold1817_cov250-Pinguiococcus_pyrenoidosus.AAC.11